MPKKAIAEQTPAQKATIDAREKLKSAEKSHADKPTDATKKAVDAAKSAVSSAVTAENRERFVRVGGGRVRKARIAIRNLANLAAPRSYTYDENDVVKMEATLLNEVKNVIAKARNALTKGAGSAKAEDDFSFE
jgi:hypothetical protein